MPDGIQIRHRHDVGQWVVVRSDEEGLILQVLLKLVSHGPLQGQELQFRGVIPGFTSLEASTGIGYGVIPAIVLLLGEHCPQSFYQRISLQQERLLEICECQNWRCETFHFQLLEHGQGVRW